MLIARSLVIPNLLPLGIELEHSPQILILDYLKLHSESI